MRSRFPRSATKTAGTFAAILGYVLLSAAYLHPAVWNLVSGEKSTYIGDGGGDPQTLPMYVNVVLETWKSRPHLLLYGTVYTPQLIAPDGVAGWIPWFERALIGLSGLVAHDAASVICVFALGVFLLNGLCFFVLGRYLRWPWFLAFALGACWAFNPFTRARIDAHFALAGTFYLPLIALGIEAAARSLRTRALTSSIIAAAAFLGAMTCAHYFIVISVFLAPLWVLLYLTRKPKSVPWNRALIRLIAVATPAVLFLSWNFFCPIPNGLMKPGANVIPVNTQSDAILYALAAKPLDYLAGEFRFGFVDWLPPRRWLSEIAGGNGRQHTAESVNGIRWTLLVFAAIAVADGLRSRRRAFPAAGRVRADLAWSALTIGAFFLSMPPNVISSFGIDLGPSRLAFKILSNFRCPSRVGPSVYFGVTMLAASYLLRTWLRERNVKGTAIFPAVLAFLAIADQPPLTSLLMTPLRRTRTELVVPGEGCGMGMYLPWAGQWAENNRSQDFYGTDCRVMTPPDAMPLDAPSLTRFARCAGLSWYVLEGMPQTLDETCRELGWTHVGFDACRAPHRLPAKSDPDVCLGRPTRRRANY